jgi:hypothetical protein
MANGSGGNAFVSHETIGFAQLCRIENFNWVKGSLIVAVALSTAQIECTVEEACEGRNILFVNIRLYFFQMNI